MVPILLFEEYSKTGAKLVIYPSTQLGVTFYYLVVSKPSYTKPADINYIGHLDHNSFAIIGFFESGLERNGWVGDYRERKLSEFGISVAMVENNDKLFDRYTAAMDAVINNKSTGDFNSSYIHWDLVPLLGLKKYPRFKF